MRRLFLSGLPLVEVARKVGRGVSSVELATHDLKRPRIKRRPRDLSARNDQILAMVLRGKSRQEVGRRFGLSPNMVGIVVARHPKVLAQLRAGAKPAAIAKRFRMELSTVLRLLRRGRRVARTRGTWQ